MGLFGWFKDTAGNWGLTGSPRHAAAIANFESGSAAFRPVYMFTYNRPYYSRSATTMDNDVRSAIGLGVPVWVSTITASTELPWIGLPSWYAGVVSDGVGKGSRIKVFNEYGKAVMGSNGRQLVMTSYYNALGANGSGGHAIAIVGYDNWNYYYIDTCARGWWGTAPGSSIGRLYYKCRAGPQDSG